MNTILLSLILFLPTTPVKSAKPDDAKLNSVIKVSYILEVKENNKWVWAGEFETRNKAIGIMRTAREGYGLYYIYRIVEVRKKIVYID